MSTSSESESLLFQWQTFSPSLSSHLSSALASGRLSDVTLLAAADSSSEPRPLRAHRLVLAAGSDFFRRLFESPSFSSAPMTSSSVVVLADVDPEDLTALVSFLYCGEARVESGRLETFLKAARNLKIHGLEQASTRKRSLQVAESRTSKVTKRDTGQEAENQENNDEGTEVKVKAEPESLVIQADPSAMDDVDEEEGDGVPCSPPRDPQQKSGENLSRSLGIKYMSVLRIRTFQHIFGISEPLVILVMPHGL